jgi:hypothetical protein
MDHDASYSAREGYLAVIGLSPKLEQPELVIVVLPIRVTVSATITVQSVELLFPDH